MGQIPFWDTTIESDLIDPDTGERVVIAPGYTGLDDVDLPWATVWLGVASRSWGGGRYSRVRLPGIAEVKLHRRRAKDKKKSSGKDGGRLTYQGYDLVEGTITLTLWKPRHLAAWSRQLDDIFPAPGKGLPKAFDIFHPNAAMLNVKAIVVDEVGSLEEGKVKGTRQVTIKVTEFLAQKKSGGKSVTKTVEASVAVRDEYNRDVPPPGVQNQRLVETGKYLPANGQQTLPSQDINFTDPDKVSSLP